jgi:hypothetical protein
MAVRRRVDFIGFLPIEYKLLSDFLVAYPVGIAATEKQDHNRVAPHKFKCICIL